MFTYTSHVCLVKNCLSCHIWRRDSRVIFSEGENRQKVLSVITKWKSNAVEWRSRPMLTKCTMWRRCACVCVHVALIGQKYCQAACRCHTLNFSRSIPPPKFHNSNKGTNLSQWLWEKAIAGVSHNNVTTGGHCFIIICVSLWALFDKWDANDFFFFFKIENPKGNIWPSLTAQLGYFDNSCSVLSLSICSVKKQSQRQTVPLTLNTSWNRPRNSRDAAFILLSREAKFIVKICLPTTICHRHVAAGQHFPLEGCFSPVYLCAEPNKVKCLGTLVGDKTVRNTQRLYFHTAICNLWRQLKSNCRTLLYSGSIVKHGNVSRLCKR